MILDALIGVFALIFSVVFEALMVLFVPVINIMAAAIEAVVGVFSAGFSLGRLSRNKNEAQSKASMTHIVVVSTIVLGLIAWFYIVPKVMYREVTLIAEDGHSLPFAALVIRTHSRNQHMRTDSAGNFSIPRFGMTAIVLNDPRYIKKIWLEPEIAAELIVERTALGSGLDALADKLLKPLKRKQDKD